MNTEFWQKAKKLMPGGVNSPVRAFGSVGGDPVLMESASGAVMRSEDGREFVDFVGSWGPMLFGHSHPLVNSALEEQLKKGISFGTATRAEVEFAQKIVDMVPSVEKLRLVNSGTEATLSAIRVARGFTGREKMIKFRGCYHGHGDSFLIEAGSGALTHGNPSSAGVTKGAARDTLLADYNSVDSVTALFKNNPNEIAALIVEPVPGNMGVVLPKPGFLEFLREICTQEGAVLIFDEVMTGFRLSAGGAQELYGVLPDLTTMGKIIGGGMPVGAYGGRSEIMSRVSPEGDVYQAGTLSGNPMAVAAGLAQLNLIRDLNPYATLEQVGQKMASSLRESAQKYGIPCHVNQVGSMLTLFFCENQVFDFESAKQTNSERYAQFFQGMLEKGYYLAPSAYEALFISAAHTDAQLNGFLLAADQVLAQIS